MQNANNLSELKLDKKNARTHSKRNLDMISKSLQDVGAARSIVIDENDNILAGGGTVTAALSVNIGKLRIVDADGSEIIAVRRSGLSDEQKKKLSLYDNRTAELAEWNNEVLESLGKELDLSFVFSDRDLIKMRLLNEVKEDKVPEVPSHARTLPGDLYELGRHRLLCGDSTNSADVERLMHGKKANMVVTSPPYFNQREYSYFETYDKYVNFITAVVRNIYLFSSESGFACLWNVRWDITNHKDIASDCSMILRQAGFTFNGAICWLKSGLGSGTMRSNHILRNQHYFPVFRHELIFIFTRGDYPRFEEEDTEFVNSVIGDVWEISQVPGSQQSKIGHPALFPVELAWRAIKSFSSRDALVFEPFAGGGTTLVAAEQTNRTCYNMEIQPTYCDVIVSRYVRLTGERTVILNGKTIQWDD